MILTALTFRAVFRLALRQTEGLIGSVIGLIGLDPAVPDRTTLCRRTETLEAPRALSGWETRLGHSSVPGMTTSPNSNRGFRFPAEIIEHAVWLYYCFGLSLRYVETILAVHDVVISYESIRKWGLRFGKAVRRYAEAAPAQAGGQLALGRSVDIVGRIRRWVGIGLEVIHEPAF